MARNLTPRCAPAPSTLARAVAAAGVLAFILAGGLAHFSAAPVEHHEPSFATDSVEAWLRHMTVTRAVPAPDLPDPPPLYVPEGF